MFVLTFATTLCQRSSLFCWDLWELGLKTIYLFSFHFSQMNSISIAVLFFFAVVSAQQQCVYNRMEAFYSTQAIQSLTIEHDFGTSRDIEFVKGDNFGIAVAASVEDPTLLLPSALSFSFSETDNTSRLVIVRIFIIIYFLLR